MRKIQYQRFNYALSYLSVTLIIIMVFTILRTTVGVFYRENVRYLQPLPQRYSSRPILSCVLIADSTKPTLRKKKVIFWKFCQQIRKFTTSKRFPHIVAAISENVLLFWVTVNVQKHLYPSLIFQYEVLQFQNFWSTLQRRVFPLSIQVISI